jgi:hypothetical protein
MGDRDTWSEADLAAGAAAKGVLRDDALLRKDAKEIGCDAVSECATKVAGRLRWPRGERADLTRMARRSLGMAVRMSLSLPSMPV